VREALVILKKSKMKSKIKIETQNSDKNIWIIGYGYIGHKVAGLYQKQSVQTSVTARSKASLISADDFAYRSFQLDLDKKQEIESGITTRITTEIKGANVFYFVPPPKQGLADTRLKNFLNMVKGQPQRIVLISTTGVYGDCNGDWVNETQSTNPVADRAKRRVDAERQVVAWSETYHTETIILRVPGIYAEDKLPLARLKKGLPIVNEAESPWTNRIHADDLATICYQAMETGYTQEIFNVSDGHPSTMTDYFNQVADYSGLPRPSQISLQQAEKKLSSGMMSYMQESRRISNSKMMKMLNIRLRYPSLADCLKKKHRTP